MKKIFFLATAAMILALGSCVRINYNKDSGIYESELNLDYHFDDGDTEGYQTGGTSIDKQVKSLDIDWVQGEVVLQVWNNKNVLIEEEAMARGTWDNSLEMCYRLDADGKLNIRYFQEGKYELTEFHGKRLIVMVPADCKLANVKVNSVSADVKIDSIQGVKLEVKSYSGSVILNDIRFEEASFSTVSGNVINEVSEEMKMDGHQGSALDVESLSGSITLNDINFEEISLKTVSGDIYLTKANAEKVKLETQSGDIKAEYVVADEISATTVSGDSELVSCRGMKLNNDTQSGDITVSGTRCQKAKMAAVSGDIEFDTENDGYDLKASTISGEVSCKKPAVKNGDQYTIGNGKVKVELSTLSGDILII